MQYWILSLKHWTFKFKIFQIGYRFSTHWDLMLATVGCNENTFNLKAEENVFSPLLSFPSLPLPSHFLSSHLSSSPSPSSPHLLSSHLPPPPSHRNFCFTRRHCFITWWWVGALTWCWCHTGFRFFWELHFIHTSIKTSPQEIINRKRVLIFHQLHFVISKRTIAVIRVLY